MSGKKEPKKKPEATPIKTDKIAVTI